MNIFERFRPYPELKTVIVNLKSGTAFRGVAWSINRKHIILRSVELLSDRGRDVNQSIDGETLVFRAEVDFLQVL